jgi:hypothetical protein
MTHFGRDGRYLSLRVVGNGGGPMEIEPIFKRHSAVVYQAAGMVSAQANCVSEDALQLMQDMATMAHVSLRKIAEGVIDRRIRFR